MDGRRFGRFRFNACGPVHPAMPTFADPPLADWSLPTSAYGDRSDLARLINQRAAGLGTARLSEVGHIIATGHQAWLWHPGILAKDIAMRVAADRLGASALHLVVDHEPYEALGIELPRQQGGRLSVAKVRLAEQDAAIPTGAQPPAAASDVRRALHRADGEGLARLIGAFTGLPECRTLAEQIAVVLARLLRPYAGDLAVMTVSDLAALPVYRALLDEMLAGASACVSAYNDAARHHPGAGVALLRVEPDRVELPLWAVAWRRLRRRVFAALGPSPPRFTFADGQPVDRANVMLLPRAVLLSAVMRWACCDLFIHGAGGGAYDRVTDAWWRRWRGQRLAPRAVVTADVRLDLDAPVADRAELRRALWYRHHLPHNVDRVLGLDGGQVRRKRELLEHMADDRDRARRARSYAQIRRINAELARTHHGALADADRRLDVARMGLANAAVAHKRDWCFALYPPSKLNRLRDAIAGEAGVPS